MFESEQAQRQRTLQRRLGAMGLEAVLLPGGRCLVATLPLGPAPFPTQGRPRHVKAVRIATVGTDRIKCLAPRALFYLPLIPISDCDSLDDLEARIRTAWSQRLAALERAQSWLEGLGIEAEAPGHTPQWTFSVGEDRAARAACIESGRLVLPSRGPLSGVRLRQAEERLFTAGAGLSSAVDLEIAVTGRMEELARLDQREQERRRRRGGDVDGRSSTLPPPPPPALLLVGPGLAANRALQDSLHVRGFRVTATRSIQEAIEAFRELSYELVLAEVRLDRADGIELIPAVRSVPGVTQVPVVLLDERARESSRDAARRAGASGYLVQPLDLAKVTPALLRLIATPRERRFRRFARALAVRGPAYPDSAVTATIGRGGMFVRTEHEVPLHSCQRHELYLPELGETLEVDSEVVYALDGSGAADRGLGLRFRTFADGKEALWVAYLRSLESAVRRS